MHQTDAGNAEQFKHSFREEAREILTELEAALLELNECRDNPEVVGRIFRGMHTIKGSGAMFGFERMAAFAHDLETAFDKVRNGQLEVAPELIDLTLGALDQIGAMLEEDVGGKAADPEHLREHSGARAAAGGHGTEPLPGRRSEQARSGAGRWRGRWRAGESASLPGPI